MTFVFLSYGVWSASERSVKMILTTCSLTVKNLMRKLGGNVHYSPPEKHSLFLIPMGEGSKEGDAISFIFPTSARNLHGSPRYIKNPVPKAPLLRWDIFFMDAQMCSRWFAIVISTDMFWKKRNNKTAIILSDDLTTCCDWAWRSMSDQRNKPTPASTTVCAHTHNVTNAFTQMCMHISTYLSAQHITPGFL